MNARPKARFRHSPRSILLQLAKGFALDILVLEVARGRRMSSTILLTMDQLGAPHELLLRTPPGQHSMAVPLL